MSVTPGLDIDSPASAGHFIAQFAQYPEPAVALITPCTLEAPNVSHHVDR
jgi:hypothetical protein